jgi:hypothetical protein
MVAFRSSHQTICDFSWGLNFVYSLTGIWIITNSSFPAALNTPLI